MIGTSNDQIICNRGARVQANIMIRICGVPIEQVRERTVHWFS
jgi:hypothetical protein